MKTLNPPPPSRTPSLLDALPLSEALPGGSGLASVRAAREADPQPTWFRLTADSWAMIRVEYLAGATAKQLALKWKVSPTSIYRHACVEGWTKEGRAQAIEDEAKARAGAEVVAQHRRDQAAAAAVEHELNWASAPADGEQVAALALGAAARCIAAGRFAEAERLGKLAETLSRLGYAGGGSGGGSGGGAGRGAAGADLPQEEPEFPPKPEAFMTPGETKRSPYQVEMLRADVERRFERLARSFDRKPTPDPLVVAYGLEDAYTCDGDDA